MAVVLTTNHGKITIELDAAKAPKTIATGRIAAFQSPI